MALKASQLKHLPASRHPDGRYGLYFNVIGNSRTWVQRLTIDGKRLNRGLGPYPVVTLAEARDIAFENVRLRHRGENPFAKAAKVRTVPTFAEAADIYIALQAKGWKPGSRNEANWRSSLVHVKAIADRPVDTVTSDDVVSVVGALVEAGKAPLARTVRQRIRSVLELARSQGHVSENVADGRIDAALPRNGHKSTNRASAAHGELSDLIARARAIGADKPKLRGVAGALEFVMLTAARAAEVLGARWDEIDLARATWTVPASRMKAGKAHRVPLSTAALSVLRAQRDRHGASGLVFRASLGGQIDGSVLRKFAKRVELAGTVHGLRGTFKSWAMESGIARDLAEMSLAHSYMGNVESAYVRTDLLEQRRPIMQAWADHIVRRFP